MNTQIRKATLIDLEPLRKLAKSTFIATYAHLNDPDVFQDYLNQAFAPVAFQRELAHAQSLFYLIEEQGHIPAYIKLNLDKAEGDLKEEDCIELERIYIEKSMQGKGYGKQLIEKAMEVGKENGKKILWLGVWEHNSKAIQFYEKCGFQYFGTHIFTLGKEEQTDYLMKRELT
ncbi:MAG: GNAT family N-acetyltransferase [Bacteroidota bacterium]